MKLEFKNDFNRSVEVLILSHYGKGFYRVSSCACKRHDDDAVSASIEIGFSDVRVEIVVNHRAELHDGLAVRVISKADDGYVTVRDFVPCGMEDIRGLVADSLDKAQAFYVA